MNEQLSLFGPAKPPSTSPRQCPPHTHGSQPGRRHTPEMATEILGEINEGRYGLMGDVERVMVFTEPDRVRKALDEDLVHHLIRAGLVRPGTDRDTLSCLHGAIRRPVTPLRLTKRGREQLARWIALRPLAERK